MFLLLDDSIQAYNYADDNSLVSSGYDYEETQQNLLKNVKKVMAWFEENHMRVNPEKFNYIVFGKNTDFTAIMLDNHLIEPVNKIKLLGLTLDNKLTFDSHISTLCQKAGKQVQVLSRLSQVLNESNKLLLYNSFVECYFNYCSYIWHEC